MLRCVPNVSAKKLSSVEGFGMRDEVCVLVHAGDSRSVRHQGIAERRPMVAAPENPLSSMISSQGKGIVVSLVGLLITPGHDVVTEVLRTTRAKDMATDWIDRSMYLYLLLSIPTAPLWGKSYAMRHNFYLQ